MRETQHLWEDLVLSVLSVNNYPLEKTHLAVERLRREGVFDMQNLVRWNWVEMVGHLKLGGYDRGDFMTGLFADRLLSLGTFVKSVGVTECERVLREGDDNEVKEFLQPVSGIGPKVLVNFLLLRKQPPKTN
jgi:hypothetical protein